MLEGGLRNQGNATLKHEFDHIEERRRGELIRCVASPGSKDSDAATPDEALLDLVAADGRAVQRPSQRVRQGRLA